MHELQKKILALAKEGKLEGLGLRDITRLVGEQYPQKIKHHILKLQEKGFLFFDLDKKKVEVAEKKSDTNLISIPIMGTANCGEALCFAENNVESYLRISRSLLDEDSDDIFAIRASGNSMNMAEIGRDKQSIENGDYVLVDSTSQKPDSGDYVLSTIGGMGNIKKFFLDNQNKRIALLSESTENYPPIFIHEDELGDHVYNGKVVRVFKQPKV